MPAQVLAALPWKEIVKALPLLIDAASRLWNATTSKPKALPIKPTDDPKLQFATLVKRLEALEESEAAQAKLVKQLLEQLQGLSLGLIEVSKRNNIALAIAASALLASGICVVMVLIR